MESAGSYFPTSHWRGDVSASFGRARSSLPLLLARSLPWPAGPLRNHLDHDLNPAPEVHPMAAVLHPSIGEGRRMTNMVIYLIVPARCGGACLSNRMGVSQVWIIAGALVIIGIGLWAAS